MSGGDPRIPFSFDLIFFFGGGFPRRHPVSVIAMDESRPGTKRMGSERDRCRAVPVPPGVCSRAGVLACVFACIRACLHGSVGVLVQTTRYRKKARSSTTEAGGAPAFGCCCCCCGGGGGGGGCRSS